MNSSELPLKLISGRNLTENQITTAHYLGFTHEYMSLDRQGHVLNSFVLLSADDASSVRGNTRSHVKKISLLSQALKKAGSVDHHVYHNALRPKDHRRVQRLAELSEANFEKVLDAETDPETIAAVHDWLPRANTPAINPSTRHGIKLDLTDKEIRALRYRPQKFDFVPPEARTEQLYKRMAAFSGGLLSLLDTARLTPEIIRIALVKHPLRGYKYLDKAQLTSDMWLEVVRVLPFELKHIPADKRTPEIVMTAVTRHWQTLRLTEPHERDEAIIMAAIRQNGNAVRYLTNTEKTPAVVRAAITKTPESILYVPASLRPGKEIL